MALSALLELSEKEYDAFASVHPYANFLNSIYSGRKFALRGWDVHYVGICHDGEMAVATLLVSVKLHGSYRYFYAPRGFLLDYADHELPQAMCQGVKQFAKERSGLYLKIDPYVPYQEHDQDGKVVEDGFCNQKIVDDLQSCGFAHQGFTRGYDMANQCRWMSVLDLRNKDEETLFQRFDAQTRWAIRRAQRNQIKLTQAGPEKLPDFMRIIDHTAARRGFDTQDETYYRELFQAYGSQVKLILAEMDLSAYQRALRKEQMQKQTELSEIQGYSCKRARHQKMLWEELDQLQQKLREVRQLEPYAQEGKVLMNGGIFICYGQEMIYLASGTYGRFLHFHPAYAMQWHMIRAAKHAGMRAYNFYGISGSFEKDQDGYGVFAFKRGFHADVVELLGDFLMPLRPWTWRAYRLMQELKRHIKKPGSLPGKQTD